MDDGNKESTKELLATLRMVAGIAISTLIVLAGLSLRGELLIMPWLLGVTVVALLLSIGVSIYVFLLAILKLSNEVEGIVGLPDIQKTTRAMLAFFAIGELTLLAALFF